MKSTIILALLLCVMGGMGGNSIAGWGSGDSKGNGIYSTDVAVPVAPGER